MRPSLRHRRQEELRTRHKMGGIHPMKPELVIAFVVTILLGFLTLLTIQFVDYKNTTKRQQKMIDVLECAHVWDDAKQIIRHSTYKEYKLCLHQR